MILTDREIHTKIASNELKIDPFDPTQVQPNSIDVRLGNHFVIYHESTTPINPYDESSIIGDTTEITSDIIILMPDDFVLARTLEYVQLPDNIVAQLDGKSSVARLGIEVHQTAGWIDSGFYGTITFEIKNVNRRPIKLYAGMPIGQLVFFETRPSEIPYNKRPGAKYNGQVNATVSKYNLNKIPRPFRAW